jgi:hypothetical protein
MKPIILSLFLTTATPSCHSSEPYVPPADYCDEIRQELDYAVTTGTLSADEALLIARRCETSSVEGG